MVVLFDAEATSEDVAAVVEAARRRGLRGRPLRLRGEAALALLGSAASLAKASAAPECAQLAAMPGVRQVRPIASAYPLVSRELQSESSHVDVDGVVVGGRDVVVMAGPCAVESEAQLFACARAARAGGATFLRGGAYKPRTSPYEFQGLGPEGLVLLQRAGAAYGLKVVTEVVEPADVARVAEHAHVLQVGARNMQNYALLQAVGRQPRPVLLKRGLCATYKEWLLAAEYVVAAGNAQVILCERGIRTFETATRNTLDVAAVPMLRALTHLPVLIDPSHATGRRDVVAAVARAGIAAGADGVLVEIHPNPELALSDGAQSLTFAQFTEMAAGLARVAEAVDRRYHPEARHEPDAA